MRQYLSHGEQNVTFMVFRKTLSPLSGPLQVVPEVENLKDDQNSNKSGENNSSNSPSELELKLRQLERKEASMIETKQANPLLAPWRVAISNPPICHVNMDAQPLTPAEIRNHRHLLAQHRPTS